MDFFLEYPDLVDEFKMLLGNSSRENETFFAAADSIEIPEGLRDYSPVLGWTIVVHERHSPPALLVKTHGYFVAVNWDKDISVVIKEVTT